MAPNFFFGALAFVLASTGQAFLFMGPLAGHTAYEEITFAAFQEISFPGCLLERMPPSQEASSALQEASFATPKISG